MPRVALYAQRGTHKQSNFLCLLNQQKLSFPLGSKRYPSPHVTDRLKRATHDRANGATKKWLNQSFGEGYFLPFFDLVF